MHPDAQTRLVHHGEHGAHAFMLIAQQITCRVVIVHDAGRVAVDAHLLFDAANGCPVALAQGTVFIDHNLWNDEQRHAFDALRTIGNFCQYQVNDVVRHVVFTRRDKDLLACNLIAAVRLWFCFGAHQPQISAAMWLCQVHRACPFARHHVWQPFVFLRFSPVGQNRGCCTVGQALIHCERHIGAGKQFAHC